MDAVKISTPKADSFRMPHVARLAKTPKENPVHAAAIETPPVHVPVSKEPGGKKGALRISRFDPQHQDLIPQATKYQVYPNLAEGSNNPQFPLTAGWALILKGCLVGQFFALWRVGQIQIL